MPEVHPFSALRYDLGQVGSLSNVIAPPYDVIDAALQDELYKKHPANVVRLILNRNEPGDDEQSNRYSRAAKFLKNWKREGVLQTDPAAAFYVYHQIFKTEDGQTHTRRGFMARCRLQRFGEGNIFPHEETLSGPKADRLKLTRACKANLSQIFGLYPDPEAKAQNLLEAAVSDHPSHDAVDHLGVTHRMWQVIDPKVISGVTAVLGPLPMFIADGHHRYETACNYRDELAAAGNLDANHPANFVLMMCIGMNDEGLLVLPTHRLFRGVPPMSSDELKSKLAPAFDVSNAGTGPDEAPAVWEEIETSGNQGTIGLYAAADKQWVLATINDAGREQIAKLSTDHSTDWQGLGVSILHRLLIENVLGLKDLPKPKYVHSIEEVVQGLTHGDDAGRDAAGQQGTGAHFGLAALVMPATVQHIKTISEHNERMPAKSTYFYPKLLCGLVINPLE